MTLHDYIIINSEGYAICSCTAEYLSVESCDKAVGKDGHGRVLFVVPNGCVCVDMKNHVA